MNSLLFNFKNKSVLSKYGENKLPKQSITKFQNSKTVLMQKEIIVLP